MFSQKRAHCLGYFWSGLCCLLTTSPWQPQRGDTCIFYLRFPSLALGLTQPCQIPNRSRDGLKSILEISSSKSTRSTSRTCLLWLGNVHLFILAAAVAVTCSVVSSEKVGAGTVDGRSFEQTTLPLSAPPCLCCLCMKRGNGLQGLGAGTGQRVFT